MSSLSLSHPDFDLSGGNPVAILANEEGATCTVCPEGEPYITTTERRIPSLGRVEEDRYLWSLVDGHRLAWTVGRLSDAPNFILSLSFYNGSSQPVRLRQLILFQTGEGELKLKGNPCDWLFTTQQLTHRIGTLAQIMAGTANDERRMLGLPPSLDSRFNNPHWRFSRDHAAFVTRRGQSTLTIGAAGDPRADLLIACEVDGCCVGLEISSEMTDVVVAPGEWRSGQDAVLLTGRHHEATEQLLRHWAATHGARTHRPPAYGWCSWYYHSGRVSAGDVTAIADYAAQSDLDMPVIQIDDGFQRTVGDWQPNEKFPHGWQPVIKHIHAAAATAGIWLAPLFVNESTGMIVSQPERFQRSADGALCGKLPLWGNPSYPLDPTHPWTHGFVRQLLRQHRETGFDYFKIDFNIVGGVSVSDPHAPRLHDTSKTRFQALRELYQAYRAEIGEDAYLLACIGFDRAVVGLADAARIGPDIGTTWQSDGFGGIKDCISAVGRTAMANGIIFANDPDVAYTRPANLMNEAELRTWHGFVGLLGGLALTSEPLSTPDVNAGSVRLELDGGHLSLELTIRDNLIVRTDPPWNGSCVDLFADDAGEIRQFWLLPSTADASARALRRGAGDQLVNEPSIRLNSKSTADGYGLQARVPLELLGASASLELIRCEIKSDVTLPNSLPGAPRTIVTAYESSYPWSSVCQYGTLRRGEPVSLELKRLGWLGTRRMYDILVPPGPEKAVPLDPDDPHHTKFGFIARRAWGDFAVVQVYNPENDSREVPLDIKSLMGTDCHVWSFWDEQYLGIHDHTIISFLASHASKILRLTPVHSSTPQIIGSNLHISVGGAEVDNFHSTTSRVRLILRPAGAPDGAIWFANDGPLDLTEFAGMEAASIAPDGPGIWKVAIKGRRRREAQWLNFVSQPKI